MGRRLLRVTTVPPGVTFPFPGYQFRTATQGFCERFVESAARVGGWPPFAGRVGGVIAAELCGQGYDLLSQTGLLPDGQPKFRPPMQRQTYYDPGQPGKKPPTIVTEKTPIPQGPSSPPGQPATPPPPQFTPSPRQPVPTVPAQPVVSPVPQRPVTPVPQSPTPTRGQPAVTPSPQPSPPPVSQTPGPRTPQPVVNPAGPQTPRVATQQPGYNPFGQTPSKPTPQPSAPPTPQKPSSPPPPQSALPGPKTVQPSPPPANQPPPKVATQVPGYNPWSQPQKPATPAIPQKPSTPAIPQTPTYVPAYPATPATPDLSFLPGPKGGSVKPGSNINTGVAGSSPVGLFPGTEGFIPIPNPLYFLNDILNGLGLGTTHIAAQKKGIQDFFTPIFKSYASHLGLPLRDNHFLQFDPEGVQKYTLNNPTYAQLLVSPGYVSGSQKIASLFQGDKTGLAERIRNQFVTNAAINKWSVEQAGNLWNYVVNAAKQ